LLYAFYRAHGKELLYRVSYKMNGNESLSCVLFYGARQRILAARFKYWHTAKIFFFLHSCNKQPLVFDVRRLETHGKDKSLPCVLLRRTAKIFLKFWFLYFFLFLHYRDIILYSIFQIHTWLHKFTIFKIMCHLNNYCRIRQIWIASA
jgi:hypothetical protein